MKYWIKSIYPLVVRKASFDSFSEVTEWIDYVIQESKEICKKKGENFIFLEEGNIFERYFLLKKINIRCDRRLKKIFNTDKDSLKWIKNKKPKNNNLNNYLNNLSKIDFKKVGRPKKIYKDIRIVKKYAI